MKMCVYIYIYINAYRNKCKETRLTGLVCLRAGKIHGLLLGLRIHENLLTHRHRAGVVLVDEKVKLL